MDSKEWSFISINPKLATEILDKTHKRFLHPKNVLGGAKKRIASSVMAGTGRQQFPNIRLIPNFWRATCSNGGNIYEIDHLRRGFHWGVFIKYLIKYKIRFTLDV